MPMVIQQHFTTPAALLTRAVGFDALGSVKTLVQLTDALALPSAEDYRIITGPPDTFAAALNTGPSSLYGVGPRGAPRQGFSQKPRERSLAGEMWPTGRNLRALAPSGRAGSGWPFRAGT